MYTPTRPWAFLVAPLFCGLASTAHAGNGMNAYGTGAQSMGMAGADLAVVDGVYALALNPAGLTRRSGREASGFVEGWWQPMRHADDLGNDEPVDNPYAAILGGGYVQRLDDERLSLGIAGFAQGGTGFVYKSLRNAFGTTDEMSALFGVFRLAPGIGWRVNEHLALGVSLGINYSSAEQKLFPDTSVPSSAGLPNGFQGLALDHASGWSYSGKLALEYQATPAWRFALSYSSETRLKLKDGDLRLNYEAEGLGRVRYRHAAISGLALPQELGFGFAYTPDAAWTLTAEVNWLDWSSALQTAMLTANAPNREEVPQTVSLPIALEWRDQYVVALGAQYQWSAVTQLRFGYNYGRNPVPDRNLSPIFNLISEHAFALGVGHALTPQWELGASLLGVVLIEQRYRNATLGLGNAQKEDWGVLDLNLTLTRRW